MSFDFVLIPIAIWGVGVIVLTVRLYAAIKAATHRPWWQVLLIGLLLDSGAEAARIERLCWKWLFIGFPIAMACSLLAALAQRGI
jgi:hypothetical protein